MNYRNHIKALGAALALAACPLAAQDGADQEQPLPLSAAATADLLGIVDGSAVGGAISDRLSIRQGHLETEVLVVIRDDDPSYELGPQLEENGLITEMDMSSHPEYMRAWVPDSRVGDLKSRLNSDFSPTASMSYYSRPVANSGEGARAMLADKYVDAGLIGSGIKVAILDIGFAGADGLSLGHDEGFEVGAQPASEDSHGAAMYEVLSGVAPEAQYIGFELNEDLDVYKATTYALSWGADIIVSPLSWFDLPGQGLAAHAARLATDNHVMWVNAAGNFGDGAYWEAEGPGVTTIGSSYYVSVGGSMIDVNQRLSVAEQEAFELHFAYEIADQSPATLALELWAGDEDAQELVASADASSNVQKLAYVADGRSLFARIRMVVPGNLEGMRMFSPGFTMGYHNAEGSIASPGGTPGVISVGAVSHENYNEAGMLEPQSSRGGGIFGLALDFAAPTGDLTSQSEIPFGGTSGAAANFAGLMALQLADPALALDPMGLLQKVELADATGDYTTAIVKALVDEFEPDNRMEDAYDIGSGQVNGRILSPSSDRDFYRIRVDQNRGIRVQMNAAGNVELLSKDGASLPLKLDADGGLRHEGLINDDAFIRVSPEAGDINFGYGLEVELFDLPLEPVELMSPADGAKDVGLNVVLSWSESPFEGVQYIVEVAADERFGKIVMQRQLAGNITEAEGLEHAQAYFWRVTVVDAQGRTAMTKPAGFSTIEEDSVVIEPGDDETKEEDLIGASGGGGEETSMDRTVAGGCTTGGSTGMLILVLMAFAGGAAATRRRRVACKA